MCFIDRQRVLSDAFQLTSAGADYRLIECNPLLLGLLLPLGMVMVHLSDAYSLPLFATL